MSESKSDEYLATIDEVCRLRDEASDAGDLLQVALCDIAIDGETAGLPAIEYLRLAPCHASHSTPQDMQEAHERGERVWAGGDKGEAWEECSRVIAYAKAEREAAQGEERAS